MKKKNKNTQDHLAITVTNAAPPANGCPAQRLLLVMLSLRFFQQFWCAMSARLDFLISLFMSAERRLFQRSPITLVSRQLTPILWLHIFKFFQLLVLWCRRLSFASLGAHSVTNRSQVICRTDYMACSVPFLPLSVSQNIPYPRLLSNSHHCFPVSQR